MTKVQAGVRWFGGLLVLLATLNSCARATSVRSNPTSAPAPAPSGAIAVYAGVGNALQVYGLDTKSGSLEVRQTVPDLKGVVQYVAVHPTRRSLYVSCNEAPA